MEDPRATYKLFDSELSSSKRIHSQVLVNDVTRRNCLVGTLQENRRSREQEVKQGREIRKTISIVIQHTVDFYIRSFNDLSVSDGHD